jgi:hypothetical protein
MYSFTIRDRQTSVPIRLLSVVCVGIASGTVLGVAECLLTMSGVDGVRECSLA